jgi:hypothetical protein
VEGIQARPAGRNRKIAMVITFLVLASLVASLVYSIIGLAAASFGVSIWASGHKKENFIKIILQCLLGIVLIYLPELLKKRFKISITNANRLMYVLFLYAAIILGEVRDYYRNFPHWDTLLHTCSGVMLASFGFALVDILNENELPRPEGRGIRFFFEKSVVG